MLVKTEIKIYNSDALVILSLNNKEIGWIIADYATLHYDIDLIKKHILDSIETITDHKLDIDIFSSEMLNLKIYLG